MDINELKDQLRRFAAERDWEKFHSPKNLAMALSVEVAEIVEIMQWMTQEESRNPDGRALKQLEQEIGDVLIYLVNLSDRLGIDPLEAAFAKLESNRSKYPAEKARGRANKYTDYQ